MNKFTLALSLMLSMAAFASEQIKGKVKLSGQVIDVVVDTNINTGRSIVFGGTEYKIMRINSTNISATNGNVTVEVFYGEVMPQIRAMDATQLAASLGVQNTDVKCSRSSKGFLVKVDGDSVLGNCIN